jgi:hypothetical protein
VQREHERGHDFDAPGVPGERLRMASEMVSEAHVGCRFHKRRRVVGGHSRKQAYAYFCEVTGEVEWSGETSAYSACTVPVDDERVVALDAERARVAGERALRPFA